MSGNFDSAAHNAVNERVSKHKDSAPDAWRLYAVAWNGVAYRFRASAEHDAAFTKSVVGQPSPPPDERYLQDHNLFAFHACAASCIECFFFGAYCFAAIHDAAAFPVASARELRQLYPNGVHQSFVSRYPDSVLTKAMSACLADTTYLAIKEHRDALSHRGSPGRTYFAGGPQDGKTMIPENPKDPSARWSYNLEIDEETTSARMKWLGATTSTLLLAASEFCKERL